MRPVGSTRPALAIRRRKFCLCRPQARQSFDRQLQLGQCEAGGKQFKDQRPVFQLAAQPTHRGRQYAAMVKGHRLAGGLQALVIVHRQLGGGAALLHPQPPVAPRLKDQPGFIEQLITLQHPLLIPRRSPLAKGNVDAVKTPAFFDLVGCRSCPGTQPGNQNAVDHCRATVAPVFPGEKAVPWQPCRLGAARWRRLADKRQIADRDNARPATPFAWIAALVTEGVKLLDIAEVQPRLLLHP